MMFTAISTEAEKKWKRSRFPHLFLAGTRANTWQKCSRESWWNSPENQADYMAGLYWY